MFNTWPRSIKPPGLICSSTIPFLQWFFKQMSLKSNIDERIKNVGFLHTTENPTNVFCYQYLSSNSFYWWKSLQNCVLIDIPFHIMIKIEVKFCHQILGELGDPNTFEGLKQWFVSVIFIQSLQMFGMIKSSTAITFLSLGWKVYSLPCVWPLVQCDVYNKITDPLSKLEFIVCKSFPNDLVFYFMLPQFETNERLLGYFEVTHTFILQFFLWRICIVPQNPQKITMKMGNGNVV